MLAKRKRSSDAFSDAGASHTDHTEASTPRGPVDEKSQLLAEKREQHAAAKLKLEEHILQAQQQMQHVAAQLEQLEGCEGGSDALGVSDLRTQLKDYQEQERRALAELAGLDKQFEAAVAEILGLPVEQQSSQLAVALQRQQQLQEAQVQQLAVEQQLAGSDFAVTDKEKHQAKKARLDRISQVWDWLQDSSAAVHGCTMAAAPEQQRHGQHDDDERPAGQHQHQQSCVDRGQQEQQHNKQDQQQEDAARNTSTAAVEAKEPQLKQLEKQQQRQEHSEVALPPPVSAAAAAATTAGGVNDKHAQLSVSHPAAAEVVTGSEASGGLTT